MGAKGSGAKARLAPIDPLNVPGGIMARLLGIASGTLTRHVGEGRMSQNPNGKYNLEETIGQFVRYATGKSDAIPQKRNALLKQQERKLRLSNDEAAGILIQTDAASDIWVEYCTRLRAGLQALPGRNASQLSGMSHTKAIRALLNDEIQSLLDYAEGAIPTLAIIDEEAAGNDAAGSDDLEAKAG